MISFDFHTYILIQCTCNKPIIVNLNILQIFLLGRLLVGLRWWNYVDDDGKSHWVYEARKVCRI